MYTDRGPMKQMHATDNLSVCWWLREYYCMPLKNRENIVLNTIYHFTVNTVYNFTLCKDNSMGCPAFLAIISYSEYEINEHKTIF